MRTSRIFLMTWTLGKVKNLPQQIKAMKLRITTKMTLISLTIIVVITPRVSRDSQISNRRKMRNLNLRENG